MPKNLKAGDRVQGYEILALLNKGAMANSFAARSPGGRKVFFKQYKSPTVTVPWYRGYVKYQAELKHRIETTRAKEYCYEFVDFFETNWGSRCYFQVFEFVEKGFDLEKSLEQHRNRPGSVSWEQRVLLAKVMMAAIHTLHETRIIHCDLKPANIQLFQDDSIAAKFRLKLIDMDYSILADVLAPWHGYQGYIGTAGYLSPEHRTAAAPTSASDVFTCGLILYELLAQGHPYRFDNLEEYSAAIKAHRAPLPRLQGKLVPPANDEQVAAVLHQALAPHPADRPSAKEINLTLNGRVDSKPVSVPTAPPPAAGQLELADASGSKLRIGIRTDVGQKLGAAFGDDARFLDERQFTLDRNGGNQWEIIPNPDTANETLLNGKTIRDRRALRDGDLIAVGRESKGIVKLPLRVKLL